MSDKQPPKLDGFSSGDYFDRDEYDAERVTNLETGLYQHITEYADALLVASNCPSLISSESPNVVYDSEQRTISRTLSRYDYNSSPFGADGLPMETSIGIRYHDSLEPSQPTTYFVEIKKAQGEEYNEGYALTALYELSRYGDSDFIDAEIIYPDVVYDTYSKRSMTPYDERVLHDELAIMAAYVQIEEEQQDSNELASD